MHPNFTPEWLEIEKIIDSVMPDTCFQELKEATSRELGSLAEGPFGNPVEPFERLVLLPQWRVERKPNAIWDRRNLLVAYELYRLWDFVFREICDQHAAIDCEEQSNVARALITLTAFERLAGRMFSEEIEGYLTRVPDDIFIRMGRELDKQRIPLAENLDARGREILKYLGRQGKPITGWQDALADNSEYEFLPRKATTREETTTLKQFGKLSRCTKRAFTERRMPIAKHSKRYTNSVYQLR